MPRRLRFVVSLIGLSAVVIVAAWLQQEAGHDRADIASTVHANETDFELTEDFLPLDLPQYYGPAFDEPQADEPQADVPQAAEPQAAVPQAEVPQNSEPEFDGPPSEVLVNPEAAITTIQDLRSQFGSVLSNSELEVADPDLDSADQTNDPASFDGFLRAAAGVTDPDTAATEVQSTGGESSTPSGNTALARSLQQTANLLWEQAGEAQWSGDTIRHQRLTGLASLLRAEANELAKPDAAGR